MNEVEWFACTDPKAMLDFVCLKTSERKLRLFAAACARLHWHLLIDEKSRKAVELSELVAEHVCPLSMLSAAYRDAWNVLPALADEPVRYVDAARAAGRTVESNAGLAARYTANEIVGLYAELSEEIGVSNDERYNLHWQGKTEGESNVISVLRDICGTLPFRLVCLNPTVLAWNDGMIPKIAQVIYEERAFDRLPILADALEDAGCDNTDILAHCRGPNEHVRGCWVVDLLLGKR